MKKLLLYACLLAGMVLPSTDLLAKKAPVSDTIYTTSQAEPFQSNIETLVRYQEERKAKEKKAAMIRIGIGVAFLVVFVIGLSRRKKR